MMSKKHIRDKDFIPSLSNSAQEGKFLSIQLCISAGWNANCVLWSAPGSPRWPAGIHRPARTAARRGCPAGRPRESKETIGFIVIKKGQPFGGLSLDLACVYMISALVWFLKMNLQFRCSLRIARPRSHVTTHMTANISIPTG